MRKSEDMSQRETIEYTELNKTVKKKRRQRSRKKRTDHVETILQSGREPKHIYTGGPKKKIYEMKNEENQIQIDRNKMPLLHRTVHFYTPRPTPLTKNYQPKLIRSPTTHDMRSKENPERNEKQGPRHK